MGKFKLTIEQQQIIDRFESHWGMDFMDKQSITGPKTFMEAYHLNQEWMRDHATESEQFTNDYYNKHFDEIE